MLKANQKVERETITSELQRLFRQRDWDDIHVVSIKYNGVAWKGLVQAIRYEDSSTKTVRLAVPYLIEGIGAEVFEVYSNLGEVVKHSGNQQQANPAPVKSR